MLTLSNVTAKTKTLIKLSLIGIVLMLIAFTLMKIVTALFDLVTPPPPPTATFGKLLGVKFPQNATDKILTFSIDTISGKLPTFPDRLNVYKLEPKKVDLLAFEKAQKKVNQIGFGTTGSLVAEDTYQWTNNIIFERKITFNLFSSDFRFLSSYFSGMASGSAVVTLEKDHALDVAREFLNRMSSFPSDIDVEKTKISLFRVENNALVPATSISKTQVIRVDFLQSDVDDLPIYYPNPLGSTINMLIAKTYNVTQVVEANFSHKPISKESSTYPIKTADQALSELKEGKAYIASYTGNSSTNILIKNAFLGYFLGVDSQKYLMPVIIFEGDHNFFAYVSAITDDWIVPFPLNK